MERRHLIVDVWPVEKPSIGLPVRHPSSEDIEPLAVLMLDAYAGTIDADGSETIDDARDEVRGYFSAEREPMPEHSFLALDGGIPVAAILVGRYEGLPFIGYVMTAATHKGRGLATALTQLTLASLHAAGERQAHLWVTRGNTHAERIYERLGFRDVEGSMDRPSDTSAGASKAQIDAIRRMNGPQRVARAFEMADAARALTESGVRHRHPDWSDTQVRDAVRNRIVHASARLPGERSDLTTG